MMLEYQVREFLILKTLTIRILQLKKAHTELEESNREDDIESSECNESSQESNNSSDSEEEI